MRLRQRDCTPLEFIVIVTAITLSAVILALRKRNVFRVRPTRNPDHPGWVRPASVTYARYAPSDGTTPPGRSVILARNEL